MKVRCPGGQTSQDRSLKLANVRPFARYEGSARIRRGRFSPSRLVAQRNDRQITHAQRIREVGHTDIQRCRDGMVADVERVVTGATGPLEWLAEDVVNSGNAVDIDRARVEQRLPAKDTSAGLSGRGLLSRLDPGLSE